jgi:hypothetical protein
MVAEALRNMVIESAIYNRVRRVMKRAARAKKRTLAGIARGIMDNIPNSSSLTSNELTALRLIVARSFMSRRSLPAATRLRLVELGLIQDALGGVSPTPAGRIVAR